MNGDARLDGLQDWNIPLKTVAGVLRVNRRTVERWARTGKLAVCRIGGRSYTSVEAILEACPISGDVASAMTRRREVHDSIGRALAIVRRGTEPRHRDRTAQTLAPTKRVTGIEPATFSLGS